MRSSLTLFMLLFSLLSYSQNEASAKRTEMIAARIDASTFDSFTMQSFELNCFENEAPGEIKIFYTDKTIQKVVYSYELTRGIGEVSYYFFKQQLNYVDHCRYSFEYLPENDSINYASKTLNNRYQIYFNGNQKVFEKQEKGPKIKENKNIDYLYYAKEIKKAAEERLTLLNKK